MMTEKQLKKRYLLQLKDYANYYFKESSAKAKERLKVMRERNMITASEAREIPIGKKYVAFAFAEVLGRSMYKDLETFKSDFNGLLKDLGLTDEDFE